MASLVYRPRLKIFKGGNTDPRSYKFRSGYLWDFFKNLPPFYFLMVVCKCQLCPSDMDSGLSAGVRPQRWPEFRQRDS